MNNKLSAILLTAVFTLIPTITLACEACGNSSVGSLPTTIGAPSTINNGGSNSSATATSANGYNTSVTTPQTQTNNVSGTSNPIGSNTNIQVNNQQTSQYGFGAGIQCQGASLGISGYDGRTTSVGYTGSSAYGLNAALILPLGGRVSNNCATLSTEIVLQRKLDTCLTILRNGFEVNPDVDADLARQCSVLRRPVVVAPVIITKEVPVVHTVIQRVPYVEIQQKIVPMVLSCDVSMTPVKIHQMVARVKYLMKHKLGPVGRKELSVLRVKLATGCNQDLVSRLLDANGSYLP